MEDHNQLPVSICVKGNCLYSWQAVCVAASMLIPLFVILVKCLLYCAEFTKLYMYQQLVSSGAAAYNSKYKDMWIVVTGATDGIGLAMAKVYAQKKAKLVIVSRTQSKLDAVKAQLEQIGASQVDTIQCDFSHINHGPNFEKDETYQRLREQLNLRQRQIGILINNVGFAGSPDWTLEVPLDSLVKTFDINFVSALIMSRLIGPQMVSRKFGTIVNVSSSVVTFRTQYFQVYYPTKLALEGLAEQLRFEYPELSFVNLRPGAVQTNMFDQAKTDDTPEWIILNADSFAKSVFNIIQAASTKRVLLTTTGHWFFESMMWTVVLADKLGLQNIIFKSMLKGPEKKAEGDKFMA